jgi:hypothetical protein
MKPKWLIEPDCFGDNNPQKLALIAQSLGYDVQMLPRNISASDLGTRVKLKFPNDECVIIYGSLELVMHTHRHHRWYPGDWCNFEKLKTSAYMAYWARWSIHFNWAFYPFAEFIRNKDQIMRRHGIGEFANEYWHYASFVRSDANNKVIGSASVVHSNEWDRWYRNVMVWHPSPEMMVMVSEPSEIAEEYRCVVSFAPQGQRKRNFVTGSRYVKDGDVSIAAMDDESDVAAFCDKILTETPYDVAPLFAMDIARLKNGELKLLEIGSINTCGLYDCDLRKVFDIANEIAVKEYKEMQDI